LNLYVHHWPLAGVTLTTGKVMLLEVDFSWINASKDPTACVLPSVEKAKPTKKGRAKHKKPTDIELACNFLRDHQTAKIIFTIDTHCLEENGLLIYSDTEHDGLGACTLEKVSDMWLWHQHRQANRNSV
jgi:hypothetical protein